MLHVANETPPGWAERMLADLDEVLVDLARGLGPVPEPMPEPELRARLAEIAAHEADVVRTAPPRPRLHG